MYQAIQVKYLPCTNFRGTRVKATATAGSVTLGYDHALNRGQNAESAMLALVKKFGWDEYPATWQGGVLPSGDYVFVRLPAAADNSNIFALLKKVERLMDIIPTRAHTSMNENLAKIGEIVTVEGLYHEVQQAIKQMEATKND